MWHYMYHSYTICLNSLWNPFRPSALCPNKKLWSNLRNIQKKLNFFLRKNEKLSGVVQQTFEIWFSWLCLKQYVRVEITLLYCIWVRMALLALYFNVKGWKVVWAEIVKKGWISWGMTCISRSDVDHSCHTGGVLRVPLGAPSGREETFYLFILF